MTQKRLSWTPATPSPNFVTRRPRIQCHSPRLSSTERRRQRKPTWYQVKVVHQHQSRKFTCPTSSTTYGRPSATTTPNVLMVTLRRKPVVSATCQKMLRPLTSQTSTTSAQDKPALCGTLCGPSPRIPPSPRCPNRTHPGGK